jgi:predicted transcriptional regulator
MDADDPTAVLREELRTVEEELTQLRETAADLRRRIGERWDDPTDSAERAGMITIAEEQEALIEELESRREDLLRRLGEHR